MAFLNGLLFNVFNFAIVAWLFWRRQRRAAAGQPFNRLGLPRYSVQLACQLPFGADLRAEGNNPVRFIADLSLFFHCDLGHNTLLTFMLE